MSFVLCDVFGEERTYAVIPDRDVVWFPLEAHLKVVVLADLSEEKGEYGVRLGLRHADDVPREAFIIIVPFPCVHACEFWGGEGAV